MKLVKMFFFLLQKLFSFSRKLGSRILDIQISWRHEMPKHKTRNTFYCITLKVKSVNEICLVYNILQKKKKLYENFDLKMSLQWIWHNLFWKMIFFKQATCIRYVLAKLSKFVQISTMTSSDSFLQSIPWKLKRAWN